MDMEQDWKAARTESARVGLMDQFDQARRVTALELAIKYEVERREEADERHRMLVTDLMIQRNDANNRAIAAAARADTAERELALAMDRLKHVLCCDGSLALCEWSTSAGQWLDMRDGMMLGELLHQIDDDRLLTESQAREAWEARQADEIARISDKIAARRAA